MEMQQKYRFDFIGNRMAAFVVSVVLIVLGIGSIAYKGGINFGVDFVGGTLVEVQFSDTPDIDAILSPHVETVVLMSYLGNE